MDADPEGGEVRRAVLAVAFLAACGPGDTPPSQTAPPASPAEPRLGDEAAIREWRMIDFDAGDRTPRALDRARSEFRDRASRHVRRLWAARAAATLSYELGQAPKVTTELLEVAVDPSEPDEMREAAMRAIGSARVGMVPFSVRADLVPALRAVIRGDQGCAVQVAVIHNLLYLGSAAEPFEPDLTAVIEDHALAEEPRIAAATALGFTGRTSATTVNRMVNGALQTPGEHREAYVRALCELLHRDAGDPAIDWRSILRLRTEMGSHQHQLRRVVDPHLRSRGLL